MSCLRAYDYSRCCVFPRWPIPWRNRRSSATRCIGVDRPEALSRGVLSGRGDQSRRMQGECHSRHVCMMRCQSNPSFIMKSFTALSHPPIHAWMREKRDIVDHRLRLSHLLRHHVSLTVWANDAAYACVPGAAESVCGLVGSQARSRTSESQLIRPHGSLRKSRPHSAYPRKSSQNIGTLYESVHMRCLTEAVMAHEQ